MEVAAALEHVMEAIFQGCKRGGPNKNVVHYFLTRWETFDDPVGVSAPLVGGRRESHGSPEVVVVESHEHSVDDCKRA